MITFIIWRLFETVGSTAAVSSSFKFQMSFDGIDRNRKINEIVTKCDINFGVVHKLIRVNETIKSL